MAIFGKQAPKWVFDLGGANEHAILFDFVYDRKFEPKDVYVEHESELNLERDVIFKGTHWTFEFKINLYKYSDDVSIVKSKFDEINSYKGKSGVLWLHRDGMQLKKADGTDALFLLREVVPFYRETRKFRDALYVKFTSLSPVDLTQSGVIIPQLADIVMSNDY